VIGVIGVIYNNINYLSHHTHILVGVIGVILDRVLPPNVA
jgi:hypothetical protein